MRVKEQVYSRNAGRCLLALLLLPLFFFSACLKSSDQPQEQETPITQENHHSGSYDPNSYFPLKQGLEWRYIHQDGTKETWTCGPYVVDSLQRGYYETRFDTGHHLSSNRRKLLQQAPLLGFVNDEGTQLFADHCTKSASGIYHLNFIQDGLKTGEFEEIFLTCSGKPLKPRYLLVGSQDTSIGEYDHVRVFTYFTMTMNWQYLAWKAHTIDADPVFRFASNSYDFRDLTNYATCYFAKGVGLIRYEYYQRRRLKDRMDLMEFKGPIE